jgi:hypothetical protein
MKTEQLGTNAEWIPIDESVCGSDGAIYFSVRPTETNFFYRAVLVP